MRQSSHPTHRSGPERPPPAGPAGGAGAAPQHRIGNRAMAAFFEEKIGPPGDAVERDAEQAAGEISSRDPAHGIGLLRGQPVEIRRLPRDAQDTAPVPQDQPSQAPARLVEDDVDPDRGQMRKSEFLAALRESVCSTADTAMAGTGRTSQGCPWIDHWLSFYERKDAAHVERALHRFAPETTAATTAREYLAPVAARVRARVERFAKTGEITGVPEELSDGPSLGGGLLGLFGGMFFKAKPGGTRTVDPVSVRSRLGRGQAIPGGLRSRMESAFQSDFGSVRIHTDPSASQISNQLGARAFTVGEHVAFGPGEFRPNTPHGDALIAHELAHVVQQSGGTAAPSPASSHGALEKNADAAAAGFVSSTWSGAKESARTIGQNAIPRLRAGLQLQSCGPTFITNRGSTVNVLSSGAPPMAPDVTEPEADSRLTSLGLLSRVVKLRPPSNNYDCHGYTFLGGDRWINDDQVDAILRDNAYAVTTTPVVGDIVVYRMGGAITHSGVIVGVSGTAVTLVESKWGRLGLYRHAPSDVPPNYGGWEAYHTSRPGGHRLRSR